MNLLNLPGFLWKLPSPQPASRFCPCFLRNQFFFVIEEEWDPRKRFPHEVLTALRPPSASSQCCSLYPECSYQSLFQPILFCYFVVKSNSAHRGVFVALFFSIFFIHLSKKCYEMCFSEYDWDDHIEFYTQICISDPLTLFFCFLSCSHFGQDNLCSPSDILQLNLSVKRTVETLLTLGAHSEESSFVSLSIQLLGFVAFYCILMLTLCMLYYWTFPL